VRFPSVLAIASRALLKLSPRSRLRRTFLRRGVSLGISAANRRDFEAAFCRFDPRAETLVPPGLASMGLEASVRGLEERKRFEGKWRTEWGEFAYVAEKLYDLGDRLLVIGRMVGTGSSSGAMFDTEWADLMTHSGGRIVREQVFLDHAEALAFVGLPGPAGRGR
jgi:ketosteroid isomerase-like protein